MCDGTTTTWRRPPLIEPVWTATKAARRAAGAREGLPYRTALNVTKA